MVRGMTVADAAKRAEVSTRTISRWLTQGMKHEVHGREKRILLVDLQAHIRAVADGRRERAARLAGRRDTYTP